MSHGIFRILNAGILQQDEDVSEMEEQGNAYRIFVTRPLVNGHLKDQSGSGMITFVMEFVEICCKPVR
jgi:hypothetical protein